MGVVAAVVTSCANSSIEPRGRPANAENDSDDGDEDEKITEPSDVTGSFLVDCSTETNGSYVTDWHRGESITACLVRSKTSNKPLAIGTIAVSAQRGDAVETLPTVERERDSAWQFGVALPPEDVSDVDHIALDITTDDDRKLTLKGTSFDFDWAHDPAFADFIEQLRLEATTAGSENAGIEPPDVGGDPPPQNSPANYVFATATLYTGGFGLDAADAACASVGPKRAGVATWKAVLSTSKQHARDRVALAGSVRTLADAVVASTPQGFWSSGGRMVGNLTTEAKTLVSAPITGVDPPAYNLRVWTGTKDDGTYDSEAGSCGDWSDAGSRSLGGAGDPTSTAKLLEAEARPCSRKARILCISQ